MRESTSTLFANKTALEKVLTQSSKTSTKYAAGPPG